MMYNDILTAIDTSATFVPVRLPANEGCQSFSLWTEDKADWYKANDAAGTNAIKVTIALSPEIPHSPSAAGTILCYAKGTSATNLVGIITKR